jgi:hypothetical protein
MCCGFVVVGLGADDVVYVYRINGAFTISDVKCDALTCTLQYLAVIAELLCWYRVDVSNWCVNLKAFV